MPNLRFWRKHDDDPDDTARDVAAEEQEKAEAEAAAARAHKVLEATEKQGEEVSRVSDSLRRFRERNHFAELIEASMRRSS